MGKIMNDETFDKLLDACEETHIHLATYKLEGYSAKEIYIINKLSNAIKYARGVIK